MSMKTFLLCLCLGIAATAEAQNAVPLKDRDAALEEPFSLIKAVRELPDGKVLVLDFLEQRVALADFRTNAIRNQDKKGSGPKEFLLPSALMPFRADSS